MFCAINIFKDVIKAVGRLTKKRESKMIFRPDLKELQLWDTWMFNEPQDRQMHLFYLACKPGKRWEWVGHAMSKDLVHWEELPPIQVRRPGDSYDVGMVGSGMVFSAKERGYVMSYTANLEGPRQGIGFMRSDDLINWKKCGDKPIIYAQPPYYETDPSKTPFNCPAFRDAYIHWVDDHYEALIAAHSTSGEPLVRGCVARYRCNDAELREWKPLPPLMGPDVAMVMELPEYFQIGRKHYLIWAGSGSFGVRCAVPSRGNTSGTYYAVSDCYEGSYTPPEENMLIGSGRWLSERLGFWDACVGRTIYWRDERLLYHQWAVKASLGIPKIIQQKSDGTLQVGYWPGLEGIHLNEINLPLSTIEALAWKLAVGEWKLMGKNAVRGSINRGPSIGVLKEGISADLHLRCNIVNESASRVGITLRDPVSPFSPPWGVAIQADFEDGAWQFGQSRHVHCCYIVPSESIVSPLEHGKSYQLDLIVRDIYFEAYVDGIWKFGRIIDKDAKEGGIGFFVEDGSAVFENIQAWKLEPMSHPS